MPPVSFFSGAERPKKKLTKWAKFEDSKYPFYVCQKWGIKIH